MSVVHDRVILKAMNQDKVTHAVELIRGENKVLGDERCKGHRVGTTSKGRKIRNMS